MTDRPRPPHRADGRPGRSPDEQQNQPFWLVVDNFADLVAVYSSDEAVATMRQVCERIATLTPCVVEEIDIRGQAARVALVPCDAASAWLLSDVLIAIGQETYRCGGEAVVLALSAQPASADLAHRLPALRASYACDRWKADMRGAVAVHEAIREDRLLLLYQPVASSPEAEQILYHECRARIVGRTHDEPILSPGQFVPALERLGLTRLFDAVVMRTVLELLGSEPDACFGCNVSALSTVDDPWWQDVCDSLLVDPRLTGRLVIEVTETAAFIDIAAARTFCEGFQRMGCRIAIDDLGAGLSSLWITRENRPDIVKVDAACLNKSAEDDFGSEFMPSLQRLTSSLAPHVIAEGIATPDDFERARSAGFCWFQGFHIGRPSLFRRCTSAPDKLLLENPTHAADVPVYNRRTFRNLDRPVGVPGGMA